MKTRIISLMLAILTMATILVMPVGAAGEVLGKQWEESEAYLNMGNLRYEFSKFNLIGAVDMGWRPVIDITVAEDGSGSAQTDLYYNKSFMDKGLIGKNGYPEGSVVTTVKGSDVFSNPALYVKVQTPRVAFKDFIELNAYLDKVAHWCDDCYTIKVYNEYVDGYKYIGIHESVNKLMNLGLPLNDTALSNGCIYKPIYVFRTSEINQKMSTGNYKKRGLPGAIYFGNGEEALQGMNFGQNEAFFFTNGGTFTGSRATGINVMVPYKKVGDIKKPWREIYVCNVAANGETGECAGGCSNAWNRGYLQNYDQVFGATIRESFDGMYVVDAERTLTMAGCVRIAAMMHSLYKKDNESFTVQSGEAWYMPYVRYAVKEGLIANAQVVTANPNKTASRLELLRMLYSVVPQNAWKDNSKYTMPVDVAGLTDADKAIIKDMSEANVLAGTETSVHNSAFNYRIEDPNVNPWKPVNLTDAAAWTSRMMAEYIY